MLPGFFGDLHCIRQNFQWVNRKQFSWRFKQSCIFQYWCQRQPDSLHLNVWVPIYKNVCDLQNQSDTKRSVFWYQSNSPDLSSLKCVRIYTKPMSAWQEQRPKGLMNIKQGNIRASACLNTENIGPREPELWIGKISQFVWFSFYAFYCSVKVFSNVQQSQQYK